MIPEEYVSVKTAKLLRDAGFPKDGSAKTYAVPTGRKRNGSFGREDVCEYITKPTQAQAMRWLRDEHRLLIQVNAEPDGLYFSIQDMSDLCYISGFPYLDCEQPTYEAAAEAGIQAACKLIIEE